MPFLVVRFDTVASPGGSAVMTYDYTGIRIKKSGSSGTTIFPFTGYEDRSGTITKFIRIGNEIIAFKQGSSTKRFYHNDHLGGVNIISDFNGNQVQLTEYDPWGKVSRSDGTVDPTHRFTGQELDSESDVHYYGGRYYDQGLGRFISPDPFVQDPDDPQNVNRYSYVLNGPQSYIDPSGYIWDYFFGGFSDFFSSFSQGSYQSRLETAQTNNQFVSNALFAGDCSWCGGTNSYDIELHKYASTAQGLVGYGVDPERPRNGLEQNVINFFAIQEGALGYQSTSPTGQLIKQMKDRGEAGRGRWSSDSTAGSIRNVNPTGGTENCVNCAIATDATLPRRPTSALPGGPTRIRVLEEFYGARFGPKVNIDQISADMAVAGHNARGIVFASRGSGQVGHVFNVVNQRGSVRFLDGQTGGPARIDGYQSFQLLRTN